MPPDKVPSEVMGMTLPSLSASISEDSFGLFVLVRKTAGPETNKSKYTTKR